MPITQSGDLGSIFSDYDGERGPVIRSGERLPISPMLRHLVYRRDRWTCQRCGAHPYPANPARRSGALHLDHIVPWSAGGLDRSDNLRTMCGPCNKERSNFMRKADKHAVPIVGICTSCLAAVDPRIAALSEHPLPRFDAYCACRHHLSWAFEGWHII
jgi:hypothetical protein